MDALIILAIVLPYTPLARLLGFAPLPPVFLLVLMVIMVFYVIVAEAAKMNFYRRMKQ